GRRQAAPGRVAAGFSGRLRPALRGGTPGRSMAWPAPLRRVRRREFFRVDIPASNPAYCLIESDALPSGSARFRIADISAGGLQLVDHDKLLVDLPVGTIFEECTLELPDADELDVGLRVLRSTHLTQDNGKPQHQVACRYFNLPDSRQITIQQYIGTLERAVLARRWGME